MDDQMWKHAANRYRIRKPRGDGKVPILKKLLSWKSGITLKTALAFASCHHVLGNEVSYAALWLASS